MSTSQVDFEIFPWISENVDLQMARDKLAIAIPGAGTHCHSLVLLDSFVGACQTMLGYLPMLLVEQTKLFFPVVWHL